MGERRGMKALELWCKKITDGYTGVKVENMTTSWRDGLAFCALIHHFRPDLIDFASLEKGDVYANNELAFRVAERHLGIPALLDAEDMALYEVPDRLSILTYLSQFYQVFASQGSSPVKRSPEPAERSMVLGSSVPSAPTKDLSCALRRREPCKACGQPVFLAQRLLVGVGQLYHRTCFRCARCSAQLSLANCYETMDGQHCCETCPDEEEEKHNSPSGDHEQKDNSNLKKLQINLSLEDNSVSQLDTAIDKPAPRPASLVGVRKLMFEQVSLGCELTDDDKVINKTRKRSLDRFRSTSDKLLTDTALDIKHAQLVKPANSDNAKHVLVRLGKHDKVSDFGCKNRKSLEIGSDFGCENRKSLEIGSDFGCENQKSLEIGSEFGCKSLEVDSGVVSDQKAKEIHHDSIPFIDSVEDVPVKFEDDVVSTNAESRPNLVVVPPVVEELLDDSDCKLNVVSLDLDQSDKCDVGLPPVSSSNGEEESCGDVGSKLDVHQDTYVEMKPLTPEPEEFEQEPIYEEIRGDLLVSKGKDEKVVVDEDVRKDNSDDVGGKELENEGEANPDDAIGTTPVPAIVESEVKPPVDSKVESEVKPPVDSKVESEVKPPVDSKVEQQSVVEVITPPKRNRKTPVVVESKLKTDSLKRISTGSAKEQSDVDYPSELNPFGDDDDDEEEEDVKNVESKGKKNSEVPAKKVSTSLNPFGSDDEDEEEEIVVPKPVERKKKHSPAPSTNPFGSDEDEEEEEEQSEASSLLQPVPLPRKLKSPPLSPTPKPRSFHSRNSSMSSSIGVPVSPSPRKKKPAPPPPPLTPKQKKSRPPPPPPKLLGSDSRSVSPTPSNLDAISLNSTISSPDIPDKSFKDATNRQKQSGGDYVPHKSIYGTWKRKKAPAPLPPIAHRRPVKPMPIKQLRQELKDIEIKQQGLERQGVTLEQTIREKFDLEASMTPYVEELILQLFELVNEKNELFRRQAELMYLRRQHHLEEEHAELEYQIRCLMLCPEQNKTDSDKEREEELIQRLVDIVERRNEIVQCLEMDRLREAEEDRSVNAQLNTLSAAAMCFDAESDRSTTPDKKGDKKSKKEKKKGKIDIDKDIDESEKQKKKSKKKWFTLQHSPKRL